MSGFQQLVPIAFTGVGVLIRENHFGRPIAYLCRDEKECLRSRVEWDSNSANNVISITENTAGTVKAMEDSGKQC
jgi:hypothetical protein